MRIRERERTVGDTMIDVCALTDKQLDNVIENHRRKGATSLPLFSQALEERAKRKGRGLSFAASRDALAAAAREGRFMSYKELADVSGAKWSHVHYSLGSHLWELVEFAHLQGWPMLSAIVVNKPNIRDGSMEPETLKGFVAAARALGHVVTDEEGFLREQQRLVFAWGETIPERREGE